MISLYIVSQNAILYIVHYLMFGFYLIFIFKFININKSDVCISY